MSIQIRWIYLVFSEELLKKGIYNEDELLGIPTGVATLALVVNKTLADEIGLDLQM